MILKVLTKNSSFQAIIIVILAVLAFLLQNTGNFDIVTALALTAFIAIIFLTYKIGVWIDFKPGEDYLPAFLLIFLSSYSLINPHETIASFFAISGLFFTINLHNEKNTHHAINFAQISVLFAISSLIYKPYLWLIAFLIINVIIFFPSVKNVLAVIFAYLLVFYLYFGVMVVLHKTTFEAIRAFFNTGDLLAIQYDLRSVIYLITLTIILLPAYLYISKNFFRFQIRVRRSFITLGFFYAAVSLINLAYMRYPALSVIVPVSIFISFFLIRSKIKLWIKNLMLFLVLLANLAIYFQIV